MTVHPGARQRRSTLGRLGPRISPDVFLHRRRQWLMALAILLLGLIIADHLHRWRPAASPAVLVDDVARYHDRIFRVTKVVDGDTLHIDSPDGDRPDTIIRLWGVDTPEVHGVDVPAWYGPEASAFTHTAADHQPVRLELLPGNARDRYGRVLAYVYLPDGTMLNEQLVEQGYAYADSRFAHPLKARFVKLEKRAHQQRLGLWSGITTDKMPPWRRQHEQPTSQPTTGAGAAYGGALSVCWQDGRSQLYLGQPMVGQFLWENPVLGPV